MRENVIPVKILIALYHLCNNICQYINKYTGYYIDANV